MSEETLFHEALAKPPQERAAFLDEACAGQPALRAAVEALLQAHEERGPFLETAPPPPFPAASAQPAGVPTAPFYPEEKGGTMVGRYKLLQQLGAGGMGVVWMAEQREPVQRRVALKIIKAELRGDQVLARFEAERQALALMDHPNIAKVLDAGATEAGRPYFVMELVKGIPLTRYCDQEHLTLKERLDLFLPVCHAVQHAHQKGVIHRDLKPSNVLIALYDGRPVPKVIDFGIAKATTQKLTERTMFTEVGQIVGTLEYMAPEQAELNNLDIDTRADIYSLGVMLYELLTGAPPFSAKQLRGGAFLEMLRLIREVEPSKPSTKLSSSAELPAIAAKRKLEPKTLARLVQGDLDWIVMKCLEKDRARRYETANELGDELKRFLADEPVQAGPPSARYRLRKFLRRNKGQVMAAALVVLALIGGIIGTSFGMIQADRALGKAEDAIEAEKAATQKALDTANANELLAAKEKKARAEAEARREQAEELALQVSFNSFYARSKENSALALVGTAQLLPKAARLKNRDLLDSMRLHLGGWAAEMPHLRWIGPHGDWVMKVALSSDGKIALTGSWDGTARLWETATGHPIGPPLQHQGAVLAIALSADGRIALTGSNDKTARL